MFGSREQSAKCKVQRAEGREQRAESKRQGGKQMGKFDIGLLGNGRDQGPKGDPSPDYQRSLIR